MSTTDGDATPEASATDPAPVSSDVADEGPPPSWDEYRSLRKEAKNHRLALRNAQQERDQLRSGVDARDRREVERMIGDRMQNTADIWLTTDLSAVRDDEGGVDADKVSAVVEQLLVDKPHWRAQGRPDFSSGVRKPIPQPKTIGQAFKQALGGR